MALPWTSRCCSPPSAPTASAEFPLIDIGRFRSVAWVGLAVNLYVARKMICEVWHEIAAYLT
jgi:hypothetical protein